MVTLSVENETNLWLLRRNWGYVLPVPLKDVATGKVRVNLMVQNKKVDMENSLSKLWDLETLGIREKDVIHENLLETTEHTVERYRVKLPWKVGHPPLPSNYGNELSRLRSQVRKLEKEPDVLRKYDHIIRISWKMELWKRYQIGR